MTFTFSDASVAHSLHWWEISEYVSEGLVIIACVGELVADLGEKCLGERRKKHVERWSTLLLVIALAASLKCIMRTNELSGAVIGSLGEKAEQADSKAKTAIADSSTALVKSEAALSNSAEAETKSREANDVANEAQKTVGTVAKRTEDVDADLARTQYLLSGRSVVDRDTLVKKLKQYKGQIIRFSSYNSEPDESLLCGDLVEAAKAAEMNVGQQNACGILFSQGNPSTGIVVSGPNIQQTLDLAQIILHTVDVGPGGVVSGIRSPELGVMVGAKPPFRIGQARGVRIPKNKQPNKANAKP
ncbi:MAG TPA: hypothetical protein VI386_25450 [Candidatus Sulfotelmatobacter sp.]